MSILKMKQQQHDINLRRTRIFFPSPPQINSNNDNNNSNI